eukprot:scaffold24490_cov60-Phaeocystis_antarctica.AAC.7
MNIIFTICERERHWVMQWASGAPNPHTVDTREALGRDVTNILRRRDLPGSRSVAEGRARARARARARRAARREGDDDVVAEDQTTGGDDSARATCDEARGDGREAVTSGGDAGDDGGDDDGGDDDGGEARGGNAAMEGGEASGGSVATTGEGEASGGDGRPAAKRHKKKNKGRDARRIDAAKGR